MLPWLTAANQSLPHHANEHIMLSADPLIYKHSRYPPLQQHTQLLVLVIWSKLSWNLNSTKRIMSLYIVRTSCPHKWHKMPLIIIYIRLERSLVVIGVSHGLLTSLQGFGVLVLERLQVWHGLHALELQTFVIVTWLHTRSTETQIYANVSHCAKPLGYYLSFVIYRRVQEDQTHTQKKCVFFVFRVYQHSGEETQKQKVKSLMK